MRYLICKVNDNQQTAYDSIEVSEREEQKITKLISNGKLPTDWVFKGKRIVTTTILGFSDKPSPPEPPATPKIKDFDELRDWIHQQKWYKRR